MDGFYIVSKIWYLLFIPVGLLIVKLLIKKYKPSIKGAAGEAVFGIASNLCLGDDYHILKDIVIPAYDGTTQIDQIVISRYGIFVIEIKTYKGWIFGKEKDPQWTQSLFNQKNKFQNPLMQNYKHIKSLEELLKLPKDKFKSVIVFSGEATFKTPMPLHVSKGTAYIDYIKSFQEDIFSEEEVKNIINIISDRFLSDAAHKDYIRNRAEKPQPTYGNKIFEEKKGFCIRCRTAIAFNTKEPYCSDCFLIWNKYKNMNYKESYCHICAEKNISSMAKPACYDCYKKTKTII